MLIKPNMLIKPYFYIFKNILINYLGTLVCIWLNKNLFNTLQLLELICCYKLLCLNYSFKNIFIKKSQLKFSIFIIWSSLWNQNSILLSKWIKYQIKVIKFWKQKILLKFIIKIFKHFTLNKFFFYNYTSLSGIKLILKGKVGVGGNARTRKYIYNIGITSLSRYSNILSYTSSTGTNTPGALGIRLWFYR